MKDLKRAKLPRSVRKCLRLEKAKIRRTTADKSACAKLIAELYGRFGLKAN